MKNLHQITLKSLAGIIVIALLVSCKINNNKGKSAENDKASEKSVMIFAAASLTDVLSEIITLFENEYGISVQTNLASSGTLARQIEQGGNPDIYISASKKWADYIDSLGLFIRDYKTEIAKNELVLISPFNRETTISEIDSSLDFTSLLGSERLSIGDPAHVPAGNYAKQSLEYFGWYERVSNKILPAKDVRSALMVVEMDEVPLGIVYGTDALKSEKVKIIATFPEQSHKPIVYIAGVCNENTPAKDFYSFLISKDLMPVWNKYGFNN